MQRDRNLYHPISIQSDLVRKNMFELIIDTEKDSLRLLCKNITLQHPKSNAVPVPWMGGVMQLAGRNSQQFTFNASFYVGTDNDSDTLADLYAWRNMVFDHISGRISLANEYKRSATIIIYEVDGDKARYTYKVEGLWPTDIADITFSVEDDTPLEIQIQFAADKMYIESLQNS